MKENDYHTIALDLSLETNNCFGALSECHRGGSRRNGTNIIERLSVRNEGDDQAVQSVQAGTARHTLP